MTYEVSQDALRKTPWAPSCKAFISKNKPKNLKQCDAYENKYLRFNTHKWFERSKVYKQPPYVDLTSSIKLQAESHKNLETVKVIEL